MIDPADRDGSGNRGDAVALLPGLRRAEDVAAALETPAVGPSTRPDPLVLLAARLAALPTVPPPAFRAELRARLVETARTGPPPAGRGPSARRPGRGRPVLLPPPGRPRRVLPTPVERRGAVPRLATALGRPAVVGSVAAAIAFGGVGVGTRQALPGDVLYGLKRSVENVQLELTTGRVHKAKARLALARIRLRELDSVIARGQLTGGAVSGAQSRLAQSLLRDWSTQANGGGDLLLDAARHGTAGAREALTEFTADQTERLTGLLPALPAGAPQRLAERNLTFMARVDADLRQTGPVGPKPPPTLATSSPSPPAFGPVAPVDPPPNGKYAGSDTPVPSARPPEPTPPPTPPPTSGRPTPLPTRSPTPARPTMPVMAPPTPPKPIHVGTVHLPPVPPTPAGRRLPVGGGPNEPDTG